MVNFNAKTKGEQYTFAKDFILRLKVISALKPNLSETDVIRFVAHKYYGDDVAGVSECIDFIEAECGAGVDIKNAPLDLKAKEYKKSLDADVKQKEEAKKAKEKEVSSKFEELRKAKVKRNKQAEEVQKAHKKMKNNNLLFLSLVATVAILAVGAIASFGGIAGTVYALTGFVSNLTFVELGTIVLAFIVGDWIRKKAKDKKKDKKDKKPSRRDRLNEEFNQTQDAYNKTKEAVDGLEKDAVKLNQDLGSAQAEVDSTKQKRSAEYAHMQSYRESNDFVNRVEFSATTIRAEYEATKQQMERDSADAASKQNLNDWYNHYIGAIFYGANNGTINNDADLDAIEQEARAKFDEIKDPLSMVDSTYNAGNVSAGTNNATNKTLDEMYASL